MARKREDIHERIIQRATKLFVQHGYGGVTMRMLARECRTSLGNLYTYYSSKDALFDAVLAPLLQELERMTNEHNQEDRLQLDDMQQHNLVMITSFMGLLDDYSDELHLLLFSSHGSKHEHFVDRFVDSQYETGVEYIRLLHERYPSARTDISENFIRLRCMDIIHLLGMMVKQRPDPAERRRMLEEFGVFGLAGWRALLLPEEEWEGRPIPARRPTS